MKKPPTPPLWKLMVAQLDSSKYEFSTCEIASLFRVLPWTVRYWAKRLFPEKLGDTRAVWYFTFEEASILIRKMCQNGRRLPVPGKLELKLRDTLVLIGPIDEHPSVKLALSLLEAKKTLSPSYHRPAFQAIPAL